MRHSESFFNVAARVKSWAVEIDFTILEIESNTHRNEFNYMITTTYLPMHDNSSYYAESTLAIFERIDL